MHTVRTGRVDFANTLRGFAALCVLVSHHWRNFWLEPGKVEALIQIPSLPVEQYTTPVYIYWLNIIPHFSWGPFGVALFFLISGFVIPFSMQRLNFKDFLVHRFFRIVPTYAVGFSITLLTLWMGLHYFEVAWPYRAQAIIIHYIPGIRDLLYSPNIDGIIWTLEIELKFYLLCALFISWFKRYSLKVFLIPVGLFVLSFAIDCQLALWMMQHPGVEHLPRWFHFLLAVVHASLYLIFMFIGVVFHYLYQGKIAARTALCWGLGILFLFWAQWRIGADAGIIDELWSYLAALLVFTFAYCFPAFFRSNRVFDFWASISYPLYVIHGVAGYVLLRLLLEYGMNSSLALVLVLSLCTSLAWCLHRWVEVPSMRMLSRPSPVTST